MYSLFSVSCFLTFFISGFTSLVLEILRLSTFGSIAVETVFLFDSFFVDFTGTFFNIIASIIPLCGTNRKVPQSGIKKYHNSASSHFISYDPVFLRE